MTNYEKIKAMTQSIDCVKAIANYLKSEVEEDG